MTNMERIQTCNDPKQIFKMMEPVMKAPVYKYLNADKYMNSENPDAYSLDVLNILEMRYIMPSPVDVLAALGKNATEEEKQNYIQSRMKKLPVVEKRRNDYMGTYYYTIVDVEMKQILKVPEESTLPCEEN